MGLHLLTAMLKSCTSGVTAFQNEFKHKCEFFFECIDSENAKNAYERASTNISKKHTLHEGIKHVLNHVIT
jgi:hypothetical protein